MSEIHINEAISCIYEKDPKRIARIQWFRLAVANGKHIRLRQREHSISLDTEINTITGDGTSIDCNLYTFIPKTLEPIELESTEQYYAHVIVIGFPVLDAIVIACSMSALKRLEKFTERCPDVDIVNMTRPDIITPTPIYPKKPKKKKPKETIKRIKPKDYIERRFNVLDLLGTKKSKLKYL